MIQEKIERPWRKTGETKNCLVCKNYFYVPKNRLSSKFCSRKCYEVDKKGKPMHENTRVALSKVIPWNKGLKASEDERVKRCVDAAHSAPKPEPWNKGQRNAVKLLYNKNLYRNIHKKAVKLFGKPMQCEDCKRSDLQRFHWANISDKYILERSDWKRLCPKCHSWFDKTKKI